MKEFVQRDGDISGRPKIDVVNIEDKVRTKGGENEDKDRAKCGENEEDIDDEQTETGTCNDDDTAGVLDTLMVPEVDNVVNNVYCFAPSEGNSPMGLFQDVNSEILAFPTLFCGQVRSIPKERVHYSIICKCIPKCISPV